jgi:hypothetical protein
VRRTRLMRAAGGTRSGHDFLGSRYLSGRAEADLSRPNLARRENGPQFRMSPRI